MPHGNALLYCAVNGIANNTNGIGRQTKTFLATLAHHHPRLTQAAGPFTPYLAVPEPGPATWGYNPADLAHARQVVEGLGGRVIALPYDTHRPMWRPAAWQALSEQAATAARGLARTHERVLAIGVDTPFAGLAHSVQPGERIDVLLALFSTAQITERPQPDPDRLAWEQDALSAASRNTHIWVAGIGTYLTRHLQQGYGLDPGRLLPWPSGLHLASADLTAPTAFYAEQTVRSFGIPTDRPVIAAVGRTDHTKGLDLLIDAVEPLRDHVHLAMIVVPTDDDRAALLTRYQARAAELQLSATLIGRYSRTLPRALAALPATRVMAVPSRGETLANIVFETGLWAQHHGAIVLAPDRDGFPEQITDGHNGLLYAPDTPGALTSGLRRALTLPDQQRGQMRENAHRRVHAERDAATHLATLLTSAWRPAGQKLDKLVGHPLPDARTPRSQAPTSTPAPRETAS
ncbi:glycosyltransferase family 4 protein [Streptomyces sp. NPDC050161]|uniref:glycosyltransferase family 4 protein n=1 Tax=Streptomyces sp. NPDC050161 TaxID=3365604 RepID=UPI0037BC00B1